MNPPSDYGYDQIALVDVQRTRLAELQRTSQQPGGVAPSRTWRRLFWLSLLLTAGGLVVSGWF